MVAAGKAAKTGAKGKPREQAKSKGSSTGAPAENASPAGLWKWAVPLIVAVAAWLYTTSQSPFPPGLDSTGGSEIRDGKVKERNPWVAGETRQRLIKSRKPEVFSGSPADNWKLRAKLKKVDDLTKIMGANTMLRVYESEDSRVLYFREEMPMAQMMEWIAPYDRTDRKTKDVVKSLKKGKLPGQKYLYHSEPTQPAIGKLIDDASEFLVVEENDESFTANYHTHVWAGAGNLSARVHYDTYWNFYVQFVGRKRFVLLPPSEWANLRLFPGMHPSGRQSQFDITERLPSSVEPLVFDLDPGDVLFIPPYWFHQVTSLEPSISVNMWTDSHDQDIEYALARSLVPTLSGASIDVLRTMTFNTLIMVSEQVPGLRDTAKTLLEAEFRPLGYTATETQNPHFQQVAMDAKLAKASYDHASKVIEQFMRLEDQHIRQIAFGNYIQTVAFWTCGHEFVGYIQYLVHTLSQ